MSDGFFIPPAWERSAADGNLIDPSTGAHLRDLPPDSMWVRGPDGTALPAYQHLDVLRAHLYRQQNGPSELLEAQHPPTRQFPGGGQSNRSPSPVRPMSWDGDQASYERYLRAQAHRPPARRKPAWPLVAMLVSWPTTFVLFIGMADAGFAHKGGFGGWAVGFVISLIASIVFTRIVARPK